MFAVAATLSKNWGHAYHDCWRQSLQFASMTRRLFCRVKQGAAWF